MPRQKTNLKEFFKDLKENFKIFKKSWDLLDKKAAKPYIYWILFLLVITVGLNTLQPGLVQFLIDALIALDINMICNSIIILLIVGILEVVFLYFRRIKRERIPLNKPCTAPSNKKGIFTNQSVAPTSFWISISCLRV